MNRFPHYPLLAQPLPDGQDTFLNWLKNQIENASIIMDPTLKIGSNLRRGWGVMTGRFGGNVKGTPIVRIPKALILSTRTVSNATVKEALRHPEFNGVMGLTIAYLYENLKGEDSPFYAYLTSVSLPDVPMLWGTEMSLLKGTHLWELEDLRIVL